MDMNSSTGEVVQLTDEVIEKRSEVKNWTKFTIGEQIEIKGITFKVHDVSDQRLVLKFVSNK